MAERSLLDRYFEALGKGDPGLLPLAPRARYTENGQMFFQYVANISEIKGKASDWSYSQSTSINRTHATDTLGQIEEMGWHLEHVGYVFVETGEISRNKVTSSGAVTRTEGYVEGVYLFRRR